MSRLLRPASCGALALAFLLPGTGAASAQSSPVVFQGLVHTAVGDATLAIDSAGALRVRTSDPWGGDGFAVDLGGRATSWSATYALRGKAPALPALTLTAIADGERISNGFLRPGGDHFTLSARFTGSTAPTYSALVYNGGRLVGSLGSLPPSAAILIPREWCEIFSLIFSCNLTSNFHNNPNGGCQWDFDLGRVVAVELPNGVRVKGDEIRLVEEVNPSGHYPYVDFDAMVLQTSADEAIVRTETVR
jgi:hypothetical protein